MPGYRLIRELVDEEFTQSLEEGRDVQKVEELRAAFASAGDDAALLNEIWEKLRNLPMRADWPFNEPSELDAIRALRIDGVRQLSFQADDAELFDRIYGAWLGRCAGCALGKPVEGFMEAHNGLSSRERIRTYLEAVSPDEYPLNFYIPQHSPAKEQTGDLMAPLSTRESIAFMEGDDDILYTVLGQMVLREKGRDFTTWDVARAWLTHLPYGGVCTAETQAYRNLVVRYDFHSQQADSAEIDWNWVATHENPYREWIGAQIRVDSWAYAAPGNPELAAEFAWRDAHMSHVGNGIYGAMFCAAMISAAFITDKPLEIVEAGLREIPQTSRLYAEMRQVIDICDKLEYSWSRFDEALDQVESLLGHYRAVHTNNNAGLCVVALLMCEGDFEKAITLAVMGGWDTDCNGATVGSISGAAHGAQALPQKWIAPLHDTLNSSLAGYHPIAISECARRSVEIARKP